MSTIYCLICRKHDSNGKTKWKCAQHLQAAGLCSYHRQTESISVDVEFSSSAETLAGLMHSTYTKSQQNYRLKLVLTFVK